MITIIKGSVAGMQVKVLFAYTIADDDKLSEIFKDNEYVIAMYSCPEHVTIYRTQFESRIVFDSLSVENRIKLSKMDDNHIFNDILRQYLRGEKLVLDK